MLSVGLLDQLGEDALQGGQRHQFGEGVRRSVSDDFSLREDNDAVTDALDCFEHMRDVEDGFALAREQDEEVLEQARGDGVEAGKRLVEDDQLGVVQQGRCDEDALLHAL